MSQPWASSLQPHSVGVVVWQLKPLDLSARTCRWGQKLWRFLEKTSLGGDFCPRRACFVGRRQIASHDEPSSCVAGRKTARDNTRRIPSATHHLSQGGLNSGQYEGGALWLLRPRGSGSRLGFQLADRVADDVVAVAHDTEVGVPISRSPGQFEQARRVGR